MSETVIIQLVAFAQRYKFLDSFQKDAARSHAAGGWSLEFRPYRGKNSCLVVTIAEQL